MDVPALISGSDPGMRLTDGQGFCWAIIGQQSYTIPNWYRITKSDQNHETWKRIFEKIINEKNDWNEISGNNVVCL